MDGPLLQRATNVKFTSFNTPISLNVSIVPEIPSGFSGYWNKAVPPLSGVFNGKGEHFVFGETKIMSSIGVEWANAAAINGSMDGFTGTCRAKLQAPMLAKMDCRRSTFPYRPPADPARIYSSLSPWIFYVGFEMIPGEMGEAINYTVMYRESEGCGLGHVSRVNCLLRSAIGLYPVNFNGSVIEISSPAKIDLVALANNTSFGDDLRYVHTVEHSSTLAGVAFQARTMYGQEVWGVNDSGVAVELNGYTGFAQKFAKTVPESILKTCTSFEDSLLGNSFRDPTDYIMDGLNDLMFRMGFAASWFDSITFGSTVVPMRALVDNGVPLSQNVAGEQFGQHNIYQTNYWYFLAAALVELVCVSCVLATYWGWWRLGREVSFSPLEIAKAFEAPLLTDAHSNSSGNDIAKIARDVPIRYGATGIASDEMPDYEAKKLAFADPNLVYRPLDSFRFET